MAVTLLTGQVVGAVPGVINDVPGAMSISGFSWLLAALLVVFVLESVTPAIHQVASLIMDAGLVREIGTGITAPLLSPRRVANIEDTEVLDIQERAKGKGGFHLAQGLGNLPWLLASRVTLVGSAVIVDVMFSWPVAATLVAVTVLLEWYCGRLIEREIDVWWGNTEDGAPVAVQGCGGASAVGDLFLELRLPEIEEVGDLCGSRSVRRTGWSWRGPGAS